MQNGEMAEEKMIEDEAIQVQVQSEQACGLEDLFAQAEDLIARLENPQLPLEEAFAAYEQGMKVIARCNERIDSVEKKMLMMNEQGELSPFDTPGGQ